MNPGDLIPWWGVAAITATASLVVGLTAALITWLSKRQDIQAADRRQWDLHKFETVSRFIALCDSLAVITWTADQKGQEKKELQANQERLRLLLMSGTLGAAAVSVIGAAVKRSRAPDESVRERARDEMRTAVENLIILTQKDLGRRGAI